MCGCSYGEHICATCELGDGGCLAGHNDDDWYPARMEQVLYRLTSHKFESSRSAMKEFLIRQYLFDYDRNSCIKIEG